MQRAIGSKVDLHAKDTIYAKEFNECIEDLVDIPDIKALDNFYQHLNTSRLQHSINVSYYSYLVCRNLDLDYRSAARAGFLHDFYLYDWRTTKVPEGRHAFAHPKIALKNAQNQVDLNTIEKDAILKHMWPLTITPPRYKESMIVSFVDKYCACCEIGINIFRKISTILFS